MRDILQDKKRGMKLDFVAAAHNEADLFTKGLGKTKTQQNLQQLSTQRECQNEIWLKLLQVSRVEGQPVAFDGNSIVRVWDQSVSVSNQLCVVPGYK